ncbi:hypothetical protein RRG08_045459 [Elysia crispata]|uniref:Uncharacterized protein n=1 Tax=Elysia crispata TaxID=231223 RepID=A0AAE1AXF1_9GAST|nr:hypothetical protein RRG08_045459 [Elysia crispata]
MVESRCENYRHRLQSALKSRVTRLGAISDNSRSKTSKKQDSRPVHSSGPLQVISFQLGGSISSCLPLPRSIVQPVFLDLDCSGFDLDINYGETKRSHEHPDMIIIGELSAK